MIVEKQTHGVTAKGMTESAEWGIKATPEALRILMEGLFSNPKSAIIRELLANAFDESDDVEVHLPTYLDSKLRIRDYGGGMTHEFMMGGFTQLFNSTKADSNSKVGAFGHGRTSPWSYTDSWTAISYTDKKRTYSAYMDETTGYTISLLAEEDMDGLRQGYEVIIPTKSGDTYDFESTVTEFCKRLPVQPKVYEGEELKDIPVVEYTMVGDKWKLRKDGGNRWQDRGYAIMGTVGYPINCSDLEGDIRKLMASPIDFTFSIGELDIVPSREGLRYTDKTIAALNKKALDVRTQLDAVLEERLEDCATEWERMVMTNKVSADLHDIITIGKGTVKVEHEMWQFERRYGGDLLARSCGHWPQLRPTENTIIIVNDKTTHRNEKVDYYLRQNNCNLQFSDGHQVFMLRQLKDEDITDKLAALGDPPVLYMSQLPRHPDAVIQAKLDKNTPRAKKTITKLKRYTRHGDLHDANRYDTSKGGVYVNIRNNQIHDSKYTVYHMKEMMHAFNLNVVYALPGSVSEAKFLKSGRWCKFDTYIDKLMCARAKGFDKGIIRQYYKDIKENQLSYHDKQIVRLVKDNYSVLNLNYKGLLCKDKERTTNYTTLRLLREHGYLDYDHTKEDDEKIIDTGTIIKKVIDKHPILSLYNGMQDDIVIKYINNGEV